MKAMQVPWSKSKPIGNKVFMAPDNMEVRKAVYDKWVQNPDREFLVDMRMGSLSCEVVIVTKQFDNYSDTWLPSDEISDEECTMKHTIFTASVVSGLGIAQCFNVLFGKPYYAYIWMSLSPVSFRREHLIKPVIGETNA